MLNRVLEKFAYYLVLLLHIFVTECAITTCDGAFREIVSLICLAL